MPLRNSFPTGWKRAIFWIKAEALLYIWRHERSAADTCQVAADWRFWKSAGDRAFSALAGCDGRGADRFSALAQRPHVFNCGKQRRAILLARAFRSLRGGCHDCTDLGRGAGGFGPGRLAASLWRSALSGLSRPLAIA